MRALNKIRSLGRQGLRRALEGRAIWTEVEPYRRPTFNVGPIPLEPWFQVLSRGYDPAFVAVEQSLKAMARPHEQLLAELDSPGYRIDPELVVEYSPQGEKLTTPASATEDFRVIAGMTGDPTWPDRDRFIPPPFLHFLTRQLRPERVLELGTAYGVSGLHIIAALEANRLGHLTTVELDPTRRALAVDAFERVFPDRQRWTSLQGSFAEILADLSQTYAPIDLVFEDGPHTGEVTLHAFEQAIDFVRPGGLYLVDDISSAGDQEQAWVQIRHDPRIRASLEINARVGVCVRA